MLQFPILALQVATRGADDLDSGELNRGALNFEDILGTELILGLVVFGVLLAVLFGLVGEELLGEVVEDVLVVADESLAVGLVDLELELLDGLVDDGAAFEV